MRILHIIAAYKPAYIYGGPTMSASQLCEQLAKAGHSIAVYATTANGPTELDVAPNKTVKVDGVDVTYFKRITKDHTHLSPALLKALWKNALSFDAVHIHTWWNLVSVLSCVVAVMRGVPVFISPRGTLSPYSFQNKNSGIKLLIHNLLGKPLLNRSHIHVTSKHEGMAIKSLVSPKSITTIPNFVKLNTGYLDAPEFELPLKLIFLSRIEEKKGLEILFNALVKVTIPYHLTIAGEGKSGYVGDLKALAKLNNLSQYITWLGFIGDEKFDLLKQHHLFVLPSYDENFGNAVIESLGVGTPVLISEEVGLADYVSENNLGWVCKRNAEEVSAMINDISNNNRAQLKKIRDTAPDIIISDFSGDKLTQQYIHLYQNITGHERL